MAYRAICTDPIIEAPSGALKCDTGWMFVEDFTADSGFNVSMLSASEIGESFAFGFFLFLIPFLTAKGLQILLSMVR